MGSIRERSRENFAEASTGISYEQIQVGAIQRIADAAEKMASSYDQLRDSHDYWKREAERSWERIDKLKRSNAALRGVITRYEKLIRKLRGQT